MRILNRPCSWRGPELLICLLIWVAQAIPSALAHDPYQFRKYAAVSASEQATNAAKAVLAAGGNAADAAVALGFALAVTFPQAGNLGGGGFLIVRTQDGKSAAVDFRERAPLLASRDMYLNASGDVDREAITLGYKAGGVPGTVSGLALVHKKWGSKPWRELLAPAIALADDGFALPLDLARDIEASKRHFSRFPSSADVFLPSGSAPRAGTIFKQPDLAKTLRLIAKKKEKGFYEGRTAELIEAAMVANDGLITRKDLKQYRSVVRSVLHGRYRGYDIYTMPPPSSGGIALLQLLGIWEKEHFPPQSFHSRRAVHWFTEAAREVYASRAVHLGDPDFYPVPVDWLVSSGFIDTAAKKIPMNKARASAEVKAASVPKAEAIETTHFSIVDGNGMAVSCTLTLNGRFGSHVVLPKTGVLLNNQMDDFSAKPGVPNMYGLVGGEANAIEPGKRMLSSMTPTIFSSANGELIVLGSPGGSRIITSVFQAAVNIIDFKMGVQQAVSAPRLHHQWLPDVLFFEPYALSEETKSALVDTGHRLVKTSPFSHVLAIFRKTKNGTLSVGLDPRRPAYAAGE